MARNSLRNLPLISLIIFTSACQAPVTSIAGAALGVYEISQQRSRLLKYAQNGDVYSQFKLSESYCCNGPDGTNQPDEAFKWLCISAKQGYAKSHVKLGKIYEGKETLDDLPIRTDMTKAYAWYSFSARRANRDGMEAEKRLRDELSQDELRQAQQMTYYGARNMECEVPANYISPYHKKKAEQAEQAKGANFEQKGAPAPVIEIENTPKTNPMRNQPPAPTYRQQQVPSGYYYAPNYGYYYGYQQPQYVAPQPYYYGNSPTAVEQATPSDKSQN